METRVKHKISGIGFNTRISGFGTGKSETKIWETENEFEVITDMKHQQLRLIIVLTVN